MTVPAWKSYLNLDELAAVLGAPVSTVKFWAIRDILRDAGERGQYSRDEAVIGAVLLSMKDALGDRSPLAFEIARAARAVVAGRLEWTAETRIPTAPVRVRFSNNAVDVLVTVSLAVFAEMAAKFDSLADAR